MREEESERKKEILSGYIEDPLKSLLAYSLVWFVFCFSSLGCHTQHRPSDCGTYTGLHLLC
jgi:hypothetical protein